MNTLFNISRLEDVAILEFNTPGSSVNAWNSASVQALDQALNNILNTEDIIGIILTSAKKDFVVGADLKQIASLDDVNSIMKDARVFHALLRKMETSGKTVVAALNGTTLGGGLEYALAAHYRICVNNKSIKIGLPEVTLGLLPGGGGTQRLPRLIGIRQALTFMLEGKRLNPSEALAEKIIDGLVNDGYELIEACVRLIKDNPKAIQPWDQKGYKIPYGAVNHPDNVMVLAASAGLILKKTFGNYPAPLNILRAVQEGLSLPFDRAIQVECRYFENCLRSPQASNLIRTFFLHMNEAGKKDVRSLQSNPKEIKTVGILGAGMMGAGIAYACMNVGIQVVLKDTDLAKAENGKKYAARLLDTLASKGKITVEEAQSKLQLIQCTESFNDLGNCDLVIEAVFEDRELKAKVTSETEAVITSDSIFASNTSTLPISGLAEASVRPDNFIGLHFFSPVDKMQLVEIIRGKKSSDYAVNQCLELVKKIKKTPIVVNDGRGFFTSRIFTTYLFEGFEMLAEGVQPALIENAGKMCGMPVGPLAVADEVSIELVYKIMKQTEKDLGVSYATPGAEIAVEMVEKFGRLGRKSGSGFYDYPTEGKKKLWKGVTELAKQNRTISNINDIKDRLLYIQVLESVKCLEEGILSRPADGDIGSVLGWGFPAWTGGVFSFIHTIGISNFIHRCQQLQVTYGNRFSVPEYLLQMEKENRNFY